MYYIIYIHNIYYHLKRQYIHIYYIYIHIHTHQFCFSIVGLLTINSCSIAYIIYLLNFFLGIFSDQIEKFLEAKKARLEDDLSIASSGKTFSSDDRYCLNERFGAALKKTTNISGSEVDALVKGAFPRILKKYGSVRIRNKFRDLKSRFLKGKLV